MRIFSTTIKSLHWRTTISSYLPLASFQGQLSTPIETLKDNYFSFSDILKRILDDHLFWRTTWIFFWISFSWIIKSKYRLCLFHINNLHCFGHSLLSLTRKLKMILRPLMLFLMLFSPIQLGVVLNVHTLLDLYIVLALTLVCFLARKSACFWGLLKLS